jgi:hypothetical protein
MEEANSKGTLADYFENDQVSVEMKGVRLLGLWINGILRIGGS